MFKQQETSIPNSGICPIPNPFPRRRSFDIPVPVIYPPGTDPFSNLHLHTDDRLQSLPPLDVDPCAALRSQIITRSTELTESEHAETNDVTVTKIQTENTRFVRCDVCNITCNSEPELKRHKEGKKHIKKMKKLAASSPIIQEVPVQVADNTDLDQELEKKKHENELSVDSLFGFSVLDVGCNDQNRFTERVEDEKHDLKVNIGDGVPESRTHNTENKLIVHQPEWCEVCKVSCSSEKNFRIHILGKKHLKNLKNPEKLPARPSTPIVSIATRPITKPVEGNPNLTTPEIIDSQKGKPKNLSGEQLTKKLEQPETMPDPSSTSRPAPCELCGISCSSNDELSVHILGKKHQKKLKNSEKLFGPTASNCEVGVERCKRKANKSLASSDEDPDTKRQKMEEEAGSGCFITCKVCNLVCNSLMAFTSHLADPEHSKMALKQVKAG